MTKNIKNTLTDWPILTHRMSVLVGCGETDAAANQQPYVRLHFARTIRQAATTLSSMPADFSSALGFALRQRHLTLELTLSWWLTTDNRNLERPLSQSRVANSAKSNCDWLSQAACFTGRQILKFLKLNVHL
jgi:hypothetical protein